MDGAVSFQEFERQGWLAENVALKYDELFSGITTQAIEPLLDAAGVRRGSRLVDVATGAGYVAAAAVERGAVVVGVDFSPTQVALARRRYPAVEFREGDAGALQLPADAFDAVTSSYGMPHFPDPDAFLRGAFSRAPRRER